uniref:Uncharacterized protein n=1 Tax=Romanomermis culicivorax TaxID=13658 RepID=A0A915HZ69_ROMCU
MLTHQMELDTKAKATATSDKTLTHIMEESSVDNETAMDVVQPATALNPSIYLATPVALPSPPMIATVATVWYIRPVTFLQQYVSDSQSAALATVLKVYNFPSPPCMLFLEHHW